MAIAVLSPKSPKAAINLLAARLRLKGLHVDHSRVAAWCQGYFLGNRQMTVAQFQELVNLFWHQPGGIQDTAGVLALASCIGRLSSPQNTLDLVQHLDYQWLLSLGYNPPVPFENFHIPDQRYPNDPYTQPREKMLETLTRMLAYAGVSNCPIVIFGQPGVGKSRLLKQLTHSTWGYPFEKKRLIYLNGGGVDAYLRTWHQEIYGFLPPWSLRLEDLAYAIRHREKTTRQIVLVDAVAHLRFIQPILEIFKDTRSIVILTPHLGLTITGLHTEKRLTTTLSGFTLDEAITFYKNRGSTFKPEDLPDFKALHTTLKGNPLAHYYAFQNVESVGLADLVALLNGSDTEIPLELLKEIFLTLQIGFERLSLILQNAFARLGALHKSHVLDQETLAALWANSAEELNLEKTSLLVTQLQTLISPFEVISDTPFKWSLHPQTHLFAKSKLESMEPAEQQLARQWADRMTQPSA